MCAKVFVASKEDRLVRELLEKIKFNCPDCSDVFSYKDRFAHFHNAIILECPFGCEDFEPCHPARLSTHMLICSSDKIKC